MKRVINILSFCLVLFIGAQIHAFAQDTTPASAATELDSLKKKLDEQEKQLTRLQKLLESQSELIQTQQNKLDALEQKSVQANEVANESKTNVAGNTVSAKTDTADKPQTDTKPEKAKSAESGFANIKFTGLLQGWYMAGNAGTRDTFRIRRTEMKFVGEITPKVKWTLMIDPSKVLSLNNTYTTVDGKQVLSNTSVNQASRVLQDAFITYSHNKKFNLNVGQFKVPLSMEGLQSSAGLDTVERALFLTDRARGGALGDVRDLGVMAFGSLTPRVDYQFGIFNGSGETFNETDKNDQKTVAGRIVTRPSFIKGLQVGASGSWSGNGSRADRPRRDRLGAEMIYVRRGFTFKSEFMAGADADTHRRGYYTHVGYRIAPKVEIIGRFDSFDPDVRFENNANNVTERDYVAGFNYLIVENKFKFQANYIRKTFANSIAPSRNLLIFNLQTSW